MYSSLWRWSSFLNAELINISAFWPAYLATQNPQQKSILNNAKHSTSMNIFDPLFTELIFGTKLALSLSVFVEPNAGSLGETARRLRGRGPDEVSRLRRAGSWGPAGEVIGSVIVPAVWLGRGRGTGLRSSVENEREGTTQLPVLPLTSLSLSLLFSLFLSQWAFWGMICVQFMNFYWQIILLIAHIISVLIVKLFYCLIKIIKNLFIFIKC